VGIVRKGLIHLANVHYHLCHFFVWFSMSDSFVFTILLNGRSCSEWSGEGPTRIEEYPVASQILKEYGVPGLHRPVGEQHIDLTRSIKVQCARIDDGGKDVFRYGPTKRSVVSKMASRSTPLGLSSKGGLLFMPGNRTEENHRE
jgi:hypothetical protein